MKRGSGSGHTIIDDTRDGRLEGVFGFVGKTVEFLRKNYFRLIDAQTMKVKEDMLYDYSPSYNYDFCICDEEDTIENHQTANGYV